MTNQEIYELLARFDASGLQSIKMCRGDFSIEMEKPAPAAVVAPQALPVAVAQEAVPSPEPAEEGMTITAPLVGTFYTAPAPDQPPFVKEGARVKQGETVALIEAMKNMLEVPAPWDCVVETVLKTNGELVSFGETLMRCKPC